ncbi:hypothetical protein BDZ89DRAFT_1071912 [Hymenopellis radicata]|nr:hypothetical protein BDZ89DRAFT_1071912 [Hymenopellis radicata]
MDLTPKGLLCINEFALRSRVSALLNDECVGWEELLAGAQNKTFTADMLRCGRVLVRVTFWLFATTTWHGTCTERKILSEIATARFVKTRTAIPVPDIYGHDMDEDGVVGGAWIVMEYVDGDNLGLIWNDMSFEKRRQEVYTSNRTFTSVLWRQA